MLYIHSNIGPCLLRSPGLRQMYRGAFYSEHQVSPCRCSSRGNKLDSYSTGTPTFFWSTWILAFPPLMFLLFLLRSSARKCVRTTVINFEEKIHFRTPRCVSGCSERMVRSVVHSSLYFQCCLLSLHYL
jgi:hypothetical protein